MRAGRREWLGLIVVAMPTLLMWVMDIYSFMIAGFLVTMGTLGDRIGRQRLLMMIGAASFGLISVTAAYAVNICMLIACRALLGIAAATLTPSTLALLSNMFKNPRQRGAAIGRGSAASWWA